MVHKSYKGEFPIEIAQALETLRFKSLTDDVPKVKVIQVVQEPPQVLSAEVLPSQGTGTVVALIGVAQIVSAVVSPIGGIQSPVAGKFFPSLVTLSAFPPALPRKTLRALKSALPRKRQKFQFLHLCSFKTPTLFVNF